MAQPPPATVERRAARSRAAAPSLEFAHPYFCTPHAVDRFRERIAPRATAARAIRDIQAGLQAPLAIRSDGERSLALCEVSGMRFVAVVGKAEAGRAWPSVLTIHHSERWQRVPLHVSGRWTALEARFARERLIDWTDEAIGRALGRTTVAVRAWRWRNHAGATSSDLLTSTEAARRCGMTPQALTKAARAGRIAGRRLPGGRWWLFRAEDLPRTGAPSSP